MLRFKLEDLPPRLREQAERQLSPSAEEGLCRRFRSTMEGKTSDCSGQQEETGNTAADIRKDIDIYTEEFVPSCVETPKRKLYSGLPNKTEEEFNRRFLNGKGVYEAITFRLAGGSLYTPDWFYMEDGVPTFVECKGYFRFGSQSRSITAFKETAASYPFWNFVWAKKEKGGSWTVVKASLRKNHV